MEKVYIDALELHESNRGKIKIENKIDVDSLEVLSRVYSPGVAQPCLEIKEDVNNVYKYTWKSNSVAVVSNGTAVLGLGNIGPEAGLPVMEGKAMLFNKMAQIDAVPLCIDVNSADDVITFCKAIAPTFGGINLEDIKAPECVYIEDQLVKELNIPVFHDDQHGTAIVTLAGLINAVKIIGKDLQDCRVVVNGAGAAGSAIVKMLSGYGISKISCFNSRGIINPKNKDQYDFVSQQICDHVEDLGDVTLSEALVGADIFVGVSVANVVSEENVKSMAKDAIVFAMANPTPEINYDLAKKAGARIVGTGRSDYPNQINNVLAFPGIFRGALDSKALSINMEMKLAAALAIAKCVDDKDIHEENIVPSALDSSVATKVAQAVAKAAVDTNNVRKS